MKPSAKQRIETILADQADARPKLTATALATLMGITKGRISQIRQNGSERPFSYQAARRLHEKYGYSIAWVLDGEGAKMDSKPGADSPPLLFIDRYKDAHHAAGRGLAAEDEGESDQIAFREDWLRDKGWHTKKMRAVPARGRSMEPRIQDGDLLLVDTADRKVANGKIYAIRHEGERRVKRLFMGADGALRIRSDNPAPEYAEDVVPADKLDSVEIIGRVVWIGGAV